MESAKHPKHRASFDKDKQTNKPAQHKQLARENFPDHVSAEHIPAFIDAPSTLTELVSSSNVLSQAQLEPKEE